MSDRSFTRYQKKHMKVKAFKRVLALALATAMVLTACGQKPAANTSESTKTSESTAAKESEKASEKEEPKEIPTLTLYPKDAALFSGLVTGYRGDYFAENGFNLEVWSYSADKTNAMLTSGDLPDMMYIGTGGLETLETLITTDKIINYDDYAEYLPHVLGDEVANEYITSNLDKCRTEFSAGTGGLYVLPFGVGVNSGIYAQTGTFDRNVPKLKWDVYEAIGAPEITDLWGLLDIAEQMLEYQPTAEDGTKMQGMFLDNGYDAFAWGGNCLWYMWHGYISMEQHFVEFSNATGEQKSIFDDDSLYKEGLKWHNEAYKRGLVDPDSVSTSREDQAPKLDNGFAMLPSGSLPGWQTKYYEVFPSDITVFRSFTTKTITNPNNSIVILKDTEHLEECLKFVDMLADPFAWLNIYYGPDGHMWKSEGNTLSITDEFAKWLEEKGNVNFFPMPDGTEYSIWNTTSMVNTGTPIPGYVDVNGDPLPYSVTSWPDAQAITTNNDNWNAWKETMGADSLWDYVEKNNITVYQDGAFDGVTAQQLDDTMTLIEASVDSVVAAASWNCVYAETEEEFEQIWDKMVEDAMALGAQDIIDWYLEWHQPVK